MEETPMDRQTHVLARKIREHTDVIHDLQKTVLELRVQRDEMMKRLRDQEDERDRLWKSVGALEEAIQVLEFPSYMECGDPEHTTVPDEEKN